MSYKNQIIKRLKFKFGRHKKISFTYNKLIFTIYTLLFIFLFTIILYSGGKRLSSLSLKLGEDKIENDILAACSKISSQLLSKHNLSYENIVVIDKDENGAINSIQTNFSKINILKNELEVMLCDFLSSHSKVTCGVPLGSVFSDDILSAAGPDIPITIITAADVDIEISDEFTDGGVNQTKHSLMLRVMVDAKLHTYTDTKATVISSNIPIAETVIIGEVPNYIL